MPVRGSLACRRLAGVAAGLAALAATLALALAWWPGGNDAPATIAPVRPSVREILGRAQAAGSAPLASGTGTLGIEERTERAEGAGAPSRTVTHRWYDGADRWRVESVTDMLGVDGQPLLSRRSLAISDGENVLTHSTGEAQAVIGPLPSWTGRVALGTFAAAPGTPRNNLPSEVSMALRGAGGCADATLLGEETVVDRRAYVLDLGPPCDGPPDARWTLWVDADLFLVLRAQYVVSGEARIRAEVTTFTVNAPADPTRFVLEPPAGVPAYDVRTAPVPTARTPGN